MPFAGLHRFGRGATCRKFVARPRRAFSILQHLGRGRELAHRRAFPVETLSLAASGWTRTTIWPRFYRERQLKEEFGLASGGTGKQLLAGTACRLVLLEILLYHPPRGLRHGDKLLHLKRGQAFGRSMSSQVPKMVQADD